MLFHLSLAVALVGIEPVVSEGMMPQGMNDPAGGGGFGNMPEGAMNDPNGDGGFGEFDDFGGDFGEDFGEDGDFDEEGGGASDMIFGALEAFSSDFQECGIDLSALFADDTDSDAMPMEMMNELKLSSPCTETQKKTMRNEFLAFQECSGYEVMELDEVALTAIMGALMKCANAMTMIDIASMDIPEQCAEALLGNHPLGKALRDVLLRPGETGDCFLQLSHKVPQCTVDLWPYPIDGKSITTGACLSSKIDQLVNEQCIEGLNTLNTCLPENKDEISLASCDSYLETCGSSESMYTTVLMMLPPHLRGMPLPDTCSSAALGQGLGSVVERYNVFRSVCASQGSKLWEKLDSNAGPALETFEEFLGSKETSNSKEPAATLEKEDTTSLTNTQSEFPMEEMKSIEEGKDEAADSDGASGSFGYGMLTGVFLAAIVYVALIVVQKKRGGAMPVTGLELGDMGGKGNAYADVPAGEAL